MLFKSVNLLFEHIAVAPKYDWQESQLFRLDILLVTKKQIDHSRILAYRLTAVETLITCFLVCLLAR